MGEQQVGQLAAAVGEDVLAGLGLKRMELDSTILSRMMVVLRPWGPSTSWKPRSRGVAKWVPGRVGLKRLGMLDMGEPAEQDRVNIGDDLEGSRADTVVPIPGHPATVGKTAVSVLIHGAGRLDDAVEG